MQNPAVIAREQLRADFSFRLAALHLAEPAGVPQLVAELAVAHHAVDVEVHVAPLHRVREQAEAQRVGAAARRANTPGPRKCPGWRRTG